MIQGSTSANKLNWFDRRAEIMCKKNMGGRKSWKTLTADDCGLGSSMQSSPCHQHALEMVEGHMGHISGQPSVNQKNALERRQERRNRHRGLVLMTLGDVREFTKQTITQLLSFKTTLKPFLSWRKLKRKRMNYPFSVISEANTEMESALWGE